MLCVESRTALKTYFRENLNDTWVGKTGSDYNSVASGHHIPVVSHTIAFLDLCDYNLNRRCTALRSTWRGYTGVWNSQGTTYVPQLEHFHTSNTSNIHTFTLYVRTPPTTSHLPNMQCFPTRSATPNFMYTPANLPTYVIFAFCRQILNLQPSVQLQHSNSPPR